MEMDKETLTTLISVLKKKMNVEQVAIPERVEKISVMWITDAPFYSEFLLRFHYFYTEAIPTIAVNCVDNQINLFINKDFVDGGGIRRKIGADNKYIHQLDKNGQKMFDDKGHPVYEIEPWLGLTNSELEAVLVHEVMHLVNKHQNRSFGSDNGSDGEVWNIAADMAINEPLKDLTIGEREVRLPKGGVYFSDAVDNGYKGANITEPLYEWLMGKKEEMKQEHGECESCGGSGKSSCPSCDGSGEDECQTCGGSGEDKNDDCQSCGGDGKEKDDQGNNVKEDCPSCGGDGQEKDEDGNSTGNDCSDCGGSGEQDKDCTECGGDGKNKSDCPDCGGDGNEKDADGNDTGNDCPSCEGEGKVDGNGPCPDCGGKGNNPCPDCAGQGEETCPDCGGSGIGGAGGDFFEDLFGSKIDSHDILEISDEFSDEIMKEIVSEGKIKGWGNIPGNMKEMLDKLTSAPKVPWKTVLRRYLSPFLYGHGNFYESAWSKRNRRVAYLPGNRKLDSKIIIGIDTSGSVSRNELKQFFTEIEAIARDVSQIIVVQWDHKVQDVCMQYKRGFWKRIGVHGRGGTSPEVMFDWVRQEKLHALPLVMLTDGEFYNDYTPSNKKLLWCCTTKEKPTGGQVIHIEVK